MPFINYYVMLKFFIPLFFCFCTTYSQVKSFSIEYEVGIDDTKKENFFNQIKNTSGYAKALIFELQCDGGESSFKQNEYLDSADHGVRFASIASGYSGEIYSKIDSDTLFISKNDVLGKYVFSTIKQKYDWELYNETKLIGTFLCYKAKTVEIVLNSKGKFEFPIEVWYTPEIPFSLGPLGYSGLPGVILELHRENVVFGAKKIILNSAISIIQPNFKKAVSEEQLNKMKEEFLRQ